MFRELQADTGDTGRHHLVERMRPTRRSRVRKQPSSLWQSGAAVGFFAIFPETIFLTLTNGGPRLPAEIRGPITTPPPPKMKNSTEFGPLFLEIGRVETYFQKKLKYVGIYIMSMTENY